MTTFDPVAFGFVRLHDFEIPVGVSVFEYGSHPIVSGAKDFLRLNLYLTLDGSYVTVWYGLLDPLIADAKLDEGFPSIERPHGIDFLQSYTDSLFAGYIDSPDAAMVIFKALRVESYAIPQILRAGDDNKVGCYVIEGFA